MSTNSIFGHIPDIISTTPTTGDIFNNVNILTHEQREAAYDMLGKLALVGQDDAVTLIKRLLTSIDRTESRLRDAQATEQAREARRLMEREEHARSIGLATSDPMERVATWTTTTTSTTAQSK